MFDLLSYLILYYEILYKHKLIDKYIDKLRNIDVTNFVYLIEKINSLPNLIYLNTISFYENNISSIVKTKPTIQAQSTRITRGKTSANPMNPLFIFNVDPKLEKVIIKERVTTTSYDTQYISKKTIKKDSININVILT